MNMRLLIVILTGLATVAQAAPPDVVIHHAKIFSGIAGRPFGEAIAIRGDRIVAVGSHEQVLKHGGCIDPQYRRGRPCGRARLQRRAHAHQSTATGGPGGGQRPGTLMGGGPLGAASAIAKSPSGPMLFAIIGGRVLEDRDANRETLDAIRPPARSGWMRGPATGPS